jgi:hypothetical protein
MKRICCLIPNMSEYIKPAVSGFANIKHKQKSMSNFFILFSIFFFVSSCTLFNNTSQKHKNMNAENLIQMNGSIFSKNIKQ